MKLIISPFERSVRLGHGLLLPHGLLPIIVRRRIVPGINPGDLPFQIGIPRRRRPCEQGLFARNRHGKPSRPGFDEIRQKSVFLRPQFDCLHFDRIFHLHFTKDDTERHSDQH